MTQPEMFETTAKGCKEYSYNTGTSRKCRIEAYAKPENRHNKNAAADPQKTTQHSRYQTTEYEEKENVSLLMCLWYKTDPNPSDVPPLRWSFHRIEPVCDSENLQ